LADTGSLKPGSVAILARDNPTLVGYLATLQPRIGEKAQDTRGIKGNERSASTEW
jgi:hypothetical protein